MKYEILKGDNGSIVDLERQVNEYIEKGWKPQGGVALTEERFVAGNRNLMVLQAMVKED